METKNINIKDLTTNDGQIEGLPKNPRQIRDHRYEKLKKSIEDAPEMLQLRELLVYPHGGKFVIIGGNMRYRACKEIGYKELPCKVLDAETPVEKLRQYAIKDNENFGEYDWDIVANEWDTAEMEDWGVELPTDWGAELDGEEIEQKEIVEDEIPENVETKCKKGEIWQLGRHRLMCGDSTKAEDVARLMNGEQADLWLTDPPYNVDYSAAKNRTNIVAGHDTNRKSIENDTMSDEDFQSFLDDVFKVADNVMRLGCSFYIWHSHTIASKIEAALNKCGLKAKQQLIWNKNSIVLGWLDYKQKHEPCFYGYKGGVNDHYFIKTFDKPTVIEDTEEIDIDKMKKDEMKKLLHEIFDSNVPTTVINEKRPTTAKEHPTMKPVRLFGRLISNSSKPGNIILDTFGGSGTTIVAAEQLNRRARLMEIDPHYCDVIIARWEKLSGGTAVKIEDV